LYLLSVFFLSPSPALRSHYFYLKVAERSAERGRGGLYFTFILFCISSLACGAWPSLKGGGERIKSAGPAEPLFLSKGARVNNIVMTLYLLIVYLFYFYDKKQKVNTYSYFSCRSVNKK
jgi:hypothetical protein